MMTLDGRRTVEWREDTPRGRLATSKSFAFNSLLSNSLIPGQLYEQIGLTAFFLEGERVRCQFENQAIKDRYTDAKIHGIEFLRYPCHILIGHSFA